MLHVRTETLTSFFKVFPLLTNDYMYMVVIALGFWLRPTSGVFTSLGFLVPFSTVLSGVLKNIFKMPRPQEDLWLVVPGDALGFPSGDVQIATVFWGMLFLATRSAYLKSLTAVLLLGISCSRVYLGVHSVYDVLAGLCVGIIILLIWKSKLIQKIITGGKNTKIFSLFICTFFTISTYIFLAKETQWPMMMVVSIGAMIGVAISFLMVSDQPRFKDVELNMRNGTIIVSSLIMLVAGAKLIPVIKTSTELMYITGIIKYAVLLWLIFTGLPKIQKYFFKENL